MLQVSSIFRLALLVIATFTATAAEAALCDRFSKPLTSNDVSEIGREVRSLFAEKYQGKLADVKMVVVPGEADMLAVSNSGRNYEIAVSASYLNTSCGLAVWSLAIAPDEPAQRAQMADMARKSCHYPTEDARRECMLGFVNGYVEGWENQLTDRRQIQDLTPLIEQMVLSSFVFALAHEYAHVILDRGGSPFTQLARTDNELAADYQALSIFASGRVWPVADSLLFNGRREFEYLLAEEEQAAVHDASYCRAARSSAIRQAITPSLTVINQWRSGLDPSFAISVLPVLLNNVALKTPKNAVSCNLQLPAELVAVRDELAALAEWTSSWPVDPVSQELAVKSLLKLPTRTETGTLVRSGIMTSYVLAPTFPAINGALDGSIRPALAQSWARRFKLADPLLAKRGNLSSKDRQKVTIARAWSDFLAMPAGSRMDPGLRRAQTMVDSAFTDHFGRPDPVDILTIASIQLLNGQCRQGVENVGSAVQALKDPLRQFGAASILISGADRKVVLRRNSEFSDIADKAKGELVTPQALQKCMANVPKLRKSLADGMGWRLDR